MNNTFTKTLLASVMLGLATLAHAQITTAAFTLGTKLSPGSSTSWSVLEDFDGDGKKDLAICNGAVSGSIYIYPGNNIVGGTIDNSTFGTKKTITTLSTPVTIDAGDVNNDGKKDLVVGYYNPLKVSVFVNTSTSGNISFASTSIDLDAGGGAPTTALLDDMDGDGLADILSVCYESSEAYVYLNTTSGGTVSFDAPLSFSLLGMNPGQARFVDLNNDNKKDIIMSMYNNTINKVQFFRNNSTSGHLDFVMDTAIWTGKSLPHRLDGSDMNGDGKADVVVSNYFEAAFTIFENTSSTGGTLSFKDPVIMNTFVYPLGTSAKDLNGDGYGDLVICGSTTGQFNIYMNKGQGGTISANTFYDSVTFTVDDNPTDITVKDVDGDNHADLIIELSNSVNVYHNNLIPVGLPFINGAKETAHVYPNPVKDLFTVELPSGITHANVQLFDIAGKCHGTFDYQDGHKLDISSLAKGVYILRLQTEGEVSTGKIIKE